MISMQPIGYVRSFYRDTQEIPKGLGARHEVEGILEIRPEFEPGLLDIEGFSHLYVIWAFDRSEGCNLVVTPPSECPDEVQVRKAFYIQEARLKFRPYLKN